MLAQTVLAQATAELVQGRPRQALALAQASTGQSAAALAAAAALRLGDTAQARRLLDRLTPSARRTVLLARCTWLEQGADTLTQELAQQARTLARQEGDAPALVAAVTLLAELQLLAADDQAGADRFAPLHTLAEGLKVAEVTGQAADAHLLAVLAAAQAPAGSARKALTTATKALARAQANSPAQVGALLLLGRPQEAQQAQQAGELDERWLRVFLVSDAHSD